MRSYENENEKITTAVVEESSAIEPAEKSVKEPPQVYIASCGTLCDVFWWARRGPG
jgi:hypothetical protein